MSRCTPPARSKPSRSSLDPIPRPCQSGAIRSIDTWAWMTPSDCTWITPTTCSPASATSDVAPSADSARLVRSASSAYSAQPSAATSPITPSRWARAYGWIDTSVIHLRPPGERVPSRWRLFRESAEFLGEADQESFGPPDVAEPVHVFVLDQFVDELCAVLAEPGERVVDVVNGEHDTQVAQSVDGGVPVVSRNRRRDESRKLESALAVRGAHHGDLDVLITQSGNTPRPLSVDRGLSFELEPELAKELDCGRQILNDDAHVVHAQCHMPKTTPWGSAAAATWRDTTERVRTHPSPRDRHPAEPGKALPPPERSAQRAVGLHPVQTANDEGTGWDLRARKHDTVAQHRSRAQPASVSDHDRPVQVRPHADLAARADQHRRLHLHSIQVRALTCVDGRRHLRRGRLEADGPGERVEVSLDELADGADIVPVRVDLMGVERDVAVEQGGKDVHRPVDEP